MDFVYIASPWSEPVYAKACLRNSLLRGETAAAMALLFDGALDLRVEIERAAGLQAALMAVRVCHRLAVYIEKGISHEMRRVISEARDCGCPLSFRHVSSPALDLPGWVVGSPEPLAVIEGGKR